MGIFDIFGSGAAKRTNRSAAENAARINQSFDAAGTAVGDARTSAQGFLQPYGEGGQRYNALYQDAMGINGAEGGQRALTSYQAGANPFLQYQQDQAQNALMRNMNARGQANSGAAALASARARQDLGYQDYNNWMGRLGQQQGQGLQVAGQQAGIEQGYGGQMADLAIGRGGALISNETNRSNAVNQARAGGMNNLLGIIGGIGGAALTGFAPGAGGVSAFGNMGNALMGRGLR